MSSTQPWVSARLIDDDETVILLLRPSLLYIPLTALGGLVVIALVTMVLAYVARRPGVAWTDTQAFGLGLGLASLRLGWQALEWYSRQYVLTDRRVMRRMGVLRESVFETRLTDIQHVTVFRRYRERCTGLATIGFTTTGSEVVEAMWVMLARPLEVYRTVQEAIERYGNHRGS